MECRKLIDSGRGTMKQLTVIILHICMNVMVCITTV
jgi:hypothetical protein